MACYHPLHAHDRAACTRTRSSHIAGPERAVVMLKRWAQLGENCDCKQAHKDAWAEVEEEAERAALPDEANLDTWAESTQLRD